MILCIDMEFNNEMIVYLMFFCYWILEIDFFMWFEYWVYVLFCNMGGCLIEFEDFFYELVIDLICDNC